MLDSNSESLQIAICATKPNDDHDDDRNDDSDDDRNDDRDDD
jgi:hypothetical protein